MVVAPVMISAEAVLKNHELIHLGFFGQMFHEKEFIHNMNRFMLYSNDTLSFMYHDTRLATIHEVSCIIIQDSQYLRIDTALVMIMNRLSDRNDPRSFSIALRFLHP